MEIKSIRDVLTANVIAVSPDTTVSETLSIMRSKKISCILITQNKKAVGIFTERDVVKSVWSGADLNNLKISELMISTVVTSTDDIDIHEAYDILVTNRIRHLAIVDRRGEVIGVVTQTDLINALDPEYFVEFKIVSQIMNKNVMSVGRGLSVRDAISKMAENSISCITVEEDSRPVGILSERDVICLAQEGIGLETIKIEEVMSHPVCTIHEDVSVHEAVMLMKQKNLRRIVVVDNDGKTKGLTTQSDIIKGLESGYIRTLKAIIYAKDKELHEKSAYLNNILSSATVDAIITTGLDYRITYFNPMAEKLYGYRVSEVIGKKLQEVFKKDNPDIKSFESAINNILHTGEHIYTIERETDEGTRYIEARVSGIRNHDGELIGYANFSRDMSKRKRYEGELIFREKAEKLISTISTNFIKLDTNEIDKGINNALRMIGEFAAADCAYVFQFCQDGTRVNKTHEWRKSGVTLQIDVSCELSVDWFPLWWMKKLRRFEAIHIPGEFDNMQQTRVVRDFLKSHDIKSLIVLPMVVKGSLIGFTGFDSVMEIKMWPDYFVNLLRRIGELFANSLNRKQIEGQIRKLSHAIEQSPVTVVITDKIGNIEYANAKFAQSTGYTIEEAIGKNPRILKSGKTSPEVYKELWNTITSGNEWRGEFCNRKKNGELYWESVSISPVKVDKGVITHFIAVKEDITGHKKMKEALLQSEKLKSIGTITSGIAHEFNNILAIISGNVQLLEGTYKDYEELTKALRTIKRATDDGAEISSKMLNFTKREKDTTGFVSYDIGELMNQSIDFTMPRWKNMAQAKGINYTMDTEGMKGVYSIMCNPTELREVFINIINNALDAMPDGGRISFGTWSKKDTVFLVISDTGSGMTEDVKRNIFDPFFTTKTPVGTGLGMSTAYGIVTRHGGKIEAASEGRGSTFTLQFPATGNAYIPKESFETEQVTKRTGLRILVVDDEVDICNLLDKFLSREGHMVRTVNSGVKAMELIRSEYYDLVLCDIAMPDVNGYEVIRVLNDLDVMPRVGIITGWGEILKPTEEGLEVAFIARKPFDFSELARQIRDSKKVCS